MLISTNAHAILNGVPSEGSNFVVALVDNLKTPSAFCTGAYLAPKVVITAAHCIIEQGQKAPSLRVPIGRLTVSQIGANLKKTPSDNQLVLVNKVWTKNTYFNRFESEKNLKEGEVDDVAILFLEKELQGKSVDRVATRLEIETFKSGVGEGFQLGYGCIKGDSVEPAPNDGIPYLAVGLKGTQKTEAHILDTNNYLGFDYQIGTGVCPGDSGSPLLQKIGEEVVYMATVYAGGGTSEILRNVPNVKAFGNSTVTWPYLDEITKQISIWQAEKPGKERKSVAELKAKGVLSNTFYTDKDSCHMGGIEGELQILKSGKWITAAPALGWDTASRCPKSHPVVPWTVTKVAENSMLRWRVWLDGAFDVTGNSFAANKPKIVTKVKSSITCTKGKVIKRVNGPKPKCPSGYKKVITR
ncbi:unannotated protein [freshwater metagenome]|uniref:Unannotated protein n=1 Tax=freshwater metagenome TaxID=449393 RepID=A0A6J6L9K0_9ZZZZ